MKESYWPMHQVAKAYSDVAQATVAPRELEASLLVKAAARLQSIKDEWDNKSSSLNEALQYNRKLWTIFASAVTRPESPLPKEVRENIASLSVFVFSRTVEAETAPTPEKLSALIDINCQIAAGLRATSVARPVESDQAMSA